MTHNTNGFRHGNYEELPDGRVRWRVRVVYLDGTTGREHGTEKNRRAAEKAVAAAVAQAGSNVDPKTAPTIAELVQEYMDVKAGTWKKRTNFNNRDIFARHIQKKIGHIRATQFRPKDLARYYQDLGRSGLGFSGQNQIASLLSGAYKLAVAETRLSAHQNPTQHIRPKRKAQATMRSSFTSQEAARFYNEAIKDQWAWPLAFMLFTGMRIGEVVGLKWSEVDFLPDGRTRVRVANTRAEHRGEIFENSPKSADSERVLMVAPEATKILRWRQERGRIEGQIAGEPVSSYVFSSLRRSSRHGQKIQPLRQDTLRGVMERICKRANIPVRPPHVLRHTWTSLLYRQGENIATLSKGLGHAKVTTTTSFYLKAFNEDVENAHLKLDGIVAPTDPDDID